ncbi:GTP cyclohydrolase I FolE2 [Treponema sp. UBA3813]|uniref:GTP cyclohydrolase I FolE2 n=1 Tax=Treponema sp. UBA3813 TaxID=1947715 RepID=UPI0025EE99FC|nr:GTP cyclohydrolase I FolE2 [Treponema sp. UBA3813]
MIDIQNTQDTREVPLQKVGVKNVRYPIQVLDKNHKVQSTTGTVNLFVNLPHNFKGTHMSRFIEVFHKHHNDISMNNFLEMLEEIRSKLDAERAFGRITFPYFIEKSAPVTKSAGLMEYTCSYEGEVSIHNEGESLPPGLQASLSPTPPSAGSNAARNARFFISIKVPVATLCPCSKAISEYGAHNQRGFVKVKVLYSKFFWIEDVIEMIENCASTPLYSVLKRKDEKFVTEHAYDNPRFVEDVVREVYLGLKKMDFKWFTVEAETEESIHFHNAYACAEYGE